MCLRLSWPSVPPSLRNVTKSPAHVYEPAAAAVVKALQHATPQAAHACGAIAPQNHTKVRTMLQILSLADLQPFESAFWRALPERLKNGGPVLGNHSSSVLDTWWVQHTALELVRHPWCYAPPPIFRGKQCPRADDRTALVRCSGAPGLNRNATPRAPGEWSLCLPALLRALAGDANPLVYSFGIAGGWTFDERMASLGFEVHSFDPTARTRKLYESHAAVPGVTFHYAGLQTSKECGLVSRSGGSYGHLGGTLRTLSGLMRGLGHSERSMRVLKIDCEGCELEAFTQMSRQEPAVLSRIEVLLVEIHLAQRQRATVATVQTFFEFVFEQHGFRLMYLRANSCVARGHSSPLHPLGHASRPDECPSAPLTHACSFRFWICACSWSCAGDGYRTGALIQSSSRSAHPSVSAATRWCSSSRASSKDSVRYVILVRRQPEHNHNSTTCTPAVASTQSSQAATCKLRHMRCR